MTLVIWQIPLNSLNVEAVNDAPEFVSPLHALVDLNNTFFYRDIHVNDVDSEEVTLELSGIHLHGYL